MDPDGKRENILTFDAFKKVFLYVSICTTQVGWLNSTYAVSLFIVVLEAVGCSLAVIQLLAHVYA